MEIDKIKAELAELRKKLNITAKNIMTMTRQKFLILNLIC